jgi:hypothetical protein
MQNINGEKCAYIVHATKKRQPKGVGYIGGRKRISTSCLAEIRQVMLIE